MASSVGEFEQASGAEEKYRESGREAGGRMGEMGALGELE